MRNKNLFSSGQVRHGSIGTCTYSADGGLTGITMKGYLYNGR